MGYRNDMTLYRSLKKIRKGEQLICEALKGSPKIWKKESIRLIMKET